MWKNHYSSPPHLNFSMLASNYCSLHVLNYFIRNFRRTYVLLLLAFVSFITAQAEHISERPEATHLQGLLQRKLSTECFNDFLSITIDLAEFGPFGITSGSQVTLMKHSNDCSGLSTSSNRTHVVIATLYTKCGTVLKALPHKDIYHNQVQLWTHTPLSETRNPANLPLAVHDFHCAVAKNSVSSTGNEQQENSDRSNPNAAENTVIRSPPHKSSSTSLSGNLILPVPEQTSMSPDQRSNLTFRMDAYDSAQFSNPLIKYPRTINLGEPLHVQITVSSMYPEEDSDLKALPVDCFFSKQSSPTKQDRPKHVLLASGCPVDSSTFILHSKTAPKQTSRLTLAMTHFYLPGAFFFLHCKVTVCSLSGSANAYGVSTCPFTTSCTVPAEQGIEKAVSFSEYVSKGPFRPVASNSRSSLQGSTCPPCPSLPPNLPFQSEQRIIIMKGLSLTVVVSISVAAFMIGVALMAGLWYITVKSSVDKRKSRVRNNRRQGCLDSSSDDSFGISNTKCSTVSACS